MQRSLLWDLFKYLEFLALNDGSLVSVGRDNSEIPNTLRSSKYLPMQKSKGIRQSISKKYNLAVIVRNFGVTDDRFSDISTRQLQLELKPMRCMCH